MNRIDLIRRVRSITRDFSSAIFREADIIDYLNEGVHRIAQIIPELEGLSELTSGDQSPTLLPNRYHHLLAIYSASRCFGQDERHYQASNYMNEFEQKIEELKVGIEEGRIHITDASGNPITVVNEPDYVVDNYFEKRYESIDVDNGVEGVE